MRKYTRSCISLVLSLLLLFNLSTPILVHAEDNTLLPPNGQGETIGIPEAEKDRTQIIYDPNPPEEILPVVLAGAVAPQVAAAASALAVGALMALTNVVMSDPDAVTEFQSFARNAYNSATSSVKSAWETATNAIALNGGRYLTSFDSSVRSHVNSLARNYEPITRFDAEGRQTMQGYQPKLANHYYDDAVYGSRWVLMSQTAVAETPNRTLYQNSVVGFSKYENGVRVERNIKLIRLDKTANKIMWTWYGVTTGIEGTGSITCGSNSSVGCYSLPTFLQDTVRFVKAFYMGAGYNYDLEYENETVVWNLISQGTQDGKPLGGAKNVRHVAKPAAIPSSPLALPAPRGTVDTAGNVTLAPPTIGRVGGTIAGSVAISPPATVPTAIPVTDSVTDLSGTVPASTTVPAEEPTSGTGEYTTWWEKLMSWLDNFFSKLAQALSWTSIMGYLSSIASTVASMPQTIAERLASVLQWTGFVALVTNLGANVANIATTIGAIPANVAESVSDALSWDRVLELLDAIKNSAGAISAGVLSGLAGVLDWTNVKGLLESIKAGTIAIPTAIAGIASALTGWFDLSKPIDWSPFRSVSVGLTTTFPFSLPWDLKRMVTSLVAEPSVPSIKIGFHTLPKTSSSPRRPGTHTIEIVNKGVRNTAITQSTKYRILADAFIVDGTVIETNDARVIKTGNWSSNDTPVVTAQVSGGSAIYSDTPLSKVALTVTANTIQYKSPKGPVSGGWHMAISEVYVDGKKVGEIDQYSASVVPSTVLWDTGLLPEAPTSTVGTEFDVPFPAFFYDLAPMVRGALLLIFALGLVYGTRRLLGGTA